MQNKIQADQSPRVGIHLYSLKQMSFLALKFEEEDTECKRLQRMHQLLQSMYLLYRVGKMSQQDCPLTEQIFLMCTPGNHFGIERL